LIKHSCESFRNPLLVQVARGDKLHRLMKVAGLVGTTSEQMAGGDGAGLMRLTGTPPAAHELEIARWPSAFSGILEMLR
jgi:hypothetical protein